MLVAEVTEQADREGEQPLAPLTVRGADLLEQQPESGGGRAPTNSRTTSPSRNAFTAGIPWIW